MQHRFHPAQSLSLFTAKIQSEASSEEKAHIDFIQQETKGYEVKVFNKEKKAEEKAVIRLIATDDSKYNGRVVLTKKHERVTGNNFIPSREIMTEHLTYELILREHRWVMETRIGKDFAEQPPKELFIESLQGSNGGEIALIGMNFIKFAIQLSHKKGLKGALKLDANENSPGFYWLAGLSYMLGEDAYYSPKIDKDIIKK